MVSALETSSLRTPHPSQGRRGEGVSHVRLKSSGRAKALSHWQSASLVFASARSVERCHVQEDATADGGMR